MDCAKQGVVKALFDHKLLPRVLSGSSVGSIGVCWGAVPFSRTYTLSFSLSVCYPGGVQR